MHFIVHFAIFVIFAVKTREITLVISTVTSVKGLSSGA